MCTKVSAYIYLCYVYVCVITGVCLHAHTHVHTHTPQFPSLQSFLHCTTTFQPAFWPLRPAAFALAGRLKGQKNEFLTLPMQEFYHSCCNPGRSHFLFCICLSFFFLFFCFLFFLFFFFGKLTLPPSWVSTHQPAYHFQISWGRSMFLLLVHIHLPFVRFRTPAL